MNPRRVKEAVLANGYRDLTFDPADPNRVFLWTEEGPPQPAFLRFSRKSSRFDNETAALTLIHQQLPSAPVPPLLLSLPEFDDGLMLVGYLPGVNLADFIPPDADIPPLPLTYQRSQPEATAGLLGAIAEAGRAVRQLHGIPLTQFGTLVGPWANPYLHDAHAHTAQETRHVLSRCVQLGIFSAHEEKKIDNWLHERLSLIAPDEKPAFIHFDLHAGNLRFEVENGRVYFLAIYDFELARGWLPEYDLALLSWDLGGLSGGWETFCRGYGGAIHPERLRLFEMIKALTAVAYSKSDHDWRDWCLQRIKRLLEG
ncbi:MAG: phosphotransferase [Anaerolineaceae bacterium]|nr:phosphotransferase [Anaerolineaceae bacterium]